MASGVILPIQTPVLPAIINIGRRETLKTHRMIPKALAQEAGLFPAQVNTIMDGVSGETIPQKGWMYIPLTIRPLTAGILLPPMNLTGLLPRMDLI
jgi:hypothetical protein